MDVLSKYKLSQMRQQEFVWPLIGMEMLTYNGIWDRWKMPKLGYYKAIS